MDFGDAVEEGQVPVRLAEMRLRPGHVRGQPLAMLEGHEPVMASMPDLR